jgi:hypothetical protein
MMNKLHTPVVGVGERVKDGAIKNKNRYDGQART